MIVQIFALHFMPGIADYGIYMMFAFLIGRFLGVDHPKAQIDKPLNTTRKIVGWVALAIFVVSFTPRPLYIEMNEKARIEQPGPEQNDDSPSKIITGRMIKVF